MCHFMQLASGTVSRERTPRRLTRDGSPASTGREHLLDSGSPMITVDLVDFVYCLGVVQRSYARLASDAARTRYKPIPSTGTPDHTCCVVCPV